MSHVSHNLSQAARYPLGRTIVLVVGDLVVFLLFVIIGEANHNESAGEFLRIVGQTGVPFMVAWLLVGLVLRMFQVSRFQSAKQAAGRTGLAWVPAGVLGLFLRSLILGRSMPVPFVIVAFVVQGILLVLWRMLFSRLLS